MSGELADRLQTLFEREKAKAPHLATLRRLGADCGVSHAYLGRLISGGQGNPTMEVLEALAMRFKTTPDFLYRGVRTVNVWQDLMRDPQFVDKSRPSSSRGERFAWVSRHLALTYPGHLSVNDQAEAMAVSPESLKSCLEGRWEPTDHQLQIISELSCVPDRWFKFGALAFMNFGQPVTTPAEIEAYLDILSLAMRHHMPPNVLEMAIRLWAEGKEKQ